MRPANCASAHAGDDRALLELASWLKWHHQLDELRELIGAEDGQVWQRLASWRSCRATWMCCACWPIWETTTPGDGWPAGWPGMATLTSCGGVPRAGTSTPGGNWPAHQPGSSTPPPTPSRRLQMVLAEIIADIGGERIMLR